MSSPFQRAFSAKSPISKALIGNQKNLPDHLKDKIKDADALLLCNDKKCLRVGPECGAGTAQARIKAQIVDWLE